MPHIGQRINRCYSELTQQEQRVADIILDHFDDLAVYNSTELANLANVSKATVTRLFKQLGFANAREVKAHARELRSQGVPLANAAADQDAPHGFVAHLAREQKNLTRSLHSLADGKFDEVVQLLENARHIKVIGFRNSYAVALHLRQQLIQCRPNVTALPQPGQVLGEELSGLAADDLVVVVGIRRRPAFFARLMAQLEQSPAEVLLLADGTARGYAARVSCFVELAVDSVSAFDSYAAAMSVVSVVANGVLHRQMRAGRTRIADINDMYTSLDELENNH
ncbi:MurR/RpiR family transcriptional regulator [Carnimonas nigrificans]|uniref:MurR/RpiR family transcriptional regulator n=1 Tax=Carnimonas nigrificans TaxID=64323 RepID=UPI0004729320|nr:MurR/RpiR family transcriptional regulator [Carnimonas nigrificans]